MPDLRNCTFRMVRQEKKMVERKVIIIENAQMPFIACLPTSSALIFIENIFTVNMIYKFCIMKLRLRM